MSRLIDADALIADLKYDVELDARALDSMDSVGKDWETIWFDKNYKQNTIGLLQHAPTIEPEPCDLCSNLEKGDTLYQSSDWDGGIGFDYIWNIQYCPKCGRRLE